MSVSIEQIKELVKSEPNDQELGRKIRELLACKCTNCKCSKNK